MKTCELAVGEIYPIIGHKVDLGLIKKFPILGPAIPVERDGRSTCIVLGEVGGVSGVMAEMICPEVVGLYSFYGAAKSDKPFAVLFGPQINSHPLARGHFRWKEKVDKNRLNRVVWNVPFHGRS